MGNIQHHGNVDVVTPGPGPAPGSFQQQPPQPQFATIADVRAMQFATITDVEALMENGISTAVSAAIAESRERERMNERKINKYRAAGAVLVIVTASVAGTLLAERYVFKTRRTVVLKP